MNRRHALLAFVAVGAAARAPATFGQQHGKVWRVGFLTSSAPAPVASNIEVFLRAMRELGYFEGKNLVVERRFAEGNLERLPGMAADLVKSKVDILVAAESPAIRAAQKATTTIPIVMVTTGDPVRNGFVASLARPGGNITGLSSMGGQMAPKLLELLLVVRPKLARVGVLVTPNRAISESAQAAAQALGVKTLMVEASSPREIANAFSTMAREGVDGVIVGAAPLFTLNKVQLAELAIKYRMPLLVGNREIVEAGGLISYAQNISEHYAHSATYVDKIMKGAKPGDLPVEQPVQFELVLNLNTAKALGIAVPYSLRMRADLIIE